MNPLTLLALAAAAWWLLGRRGGQPEATPQIAAASTVFTYQGRTYRVVGAPNEAGLVPVQYQPPAGMLAAQVVEWFDPVTGSIVREA